MDKIYIDSENLVTIDELKNEETGAYLTGGDTVVMTLFKRSPLHIDEDGVAADKGGGKVGIPVAAHGLATNDIVRISETENYNGEYTLDATSTADEVVITATYVAETFTGRENVFVGLASCYQVPLSYVAASSGKFQGYVQDTTHLIEGDRYILFVSVTSGPANLLIRMNLMAQFVE